MSVPIGVGSGGGPLTLHIVVGGTGDFTERPVLTVKCARHRTVRWLITEIRKCLRNDLISELRYLPRQKWPTSGADAAREQEAAADSSPAGSRGGGGLGLTLEPLSVSALLVTPTVIEELPLPLDLAVGEIGVPDHAMALALLSGMRRSAQTRYLPTAYEHPKPTEMVHAPKPTLRAPNRVGGKILFADTITNDTTGRTLPLTRETKLHRSYYPAVLGLRAGGKSSGGCCAIS